MKTLLVLEEGHSDMKLLYHLLKDYRLVAATSAEQALKLFRDRVCRIDLFLAAVTPVGSGIQVALHLRMEIPDLPVILTSSCLMSDWSDPDAASLQELGSNLVVVLQDSSSGQGSQFHGSANPGQAKPNGWSSLCRGSPRQRTTARFGAVDFDHTTS